MDTLKKAGLMTQHLDLFHHMQDLRALLQLAAHMEERGDRAALISAGQLTLIGEAGSPVGAESVTTSKGATLAAGVVYRLMAQLKGFEDDEYTVNRKELAALNTRAVAELESSDALRAFADTLTRIGAAGTPGGAAQTTTPASTAAASTPVTNPAHASSPSPAPDTASGERQGMERPSAERQSRGRRVPEEQAGEGVAAAN